MHIWILSYECSENVAEKTFLDIYLWIMTDIVDKALELRQYKNDWILKKYSVGLNLPRFLITVYATFG